jgi:hypothetical protein
LILYYNTEQSYVYECHIWGLLPDLNILQEYLLKYAHRNLIKIKKRVQLLKNLLEEYPYLDPKYVPPKIGLSNDPNIQCWQTRGIKYKHVTHIFNTQMSDMTLTQELEAVLDSIMANPKVLHVLIGTLGSGKSFFY